MITRNREMEACEGYFLIETAGGERHQVTDTLYSED